MNEQHSSAAVIVTAPADPAGTITSGMATTNVAITNLKRLPLVELSTIPSPGVLAPEGDPKGDPTGAA